MKQSTTSPYLIYSTNTDTSYVSATDQFDVGYAKGRTDFIAYESLFVLFVLGIWAIYRGLTLSYGLWRQRLYQEFVDANLDAWRSQTPVAAQVNRPYAHTFQPWPAVNHLPPMRTYPSILESIFNGIYPHKPFPVDPNAPKRPLFISRYVTVRFEPGTPGGHIDP